MKYLTMILALASASSFAAIHVTAEIELANGKKMKPSLSMENGKSASLQQDGVELKLRAKKKGLTGVDLFYEIIQHDGEKSKKMAKSHILAHWSQSSEIKTKQGKNVKLLKLKLTPSLLE